MRGICIAQRLKARALEPDRRSFLVLQILGRVAPAKLVSLYRLPINGEEYLPQDYCED